MYISYLIYYVEYRCQADSSFCALGDAFPALKALPGEFQVCGGQGNGSGKSPWFQWFL